MIYTPYYEKIKQTVRRRVPSNLVYFLIIKYTNLRAFVIRDPQT